MPKTTEDHHSGSSLSWSAIVAVVIAIVVIGLGVVAFRSLSSDDTVGHVVIATGPESGTYHTLGVRLASMLEDSGLVESTEVLITDGSVSNMDMISAGEADIAIIQSDTRVDQQARLVARLYNEVLHILVARDAAEEIRTIQDLGDRRVAMGSAGSGTRQVAQRVLHHFQVEAVEDLALAPSEAAAALLDGSADAVFQLTAIPSSTVAQLCREEAAVFLSLGDAQEVGNEADALALVFPAMHHETIPRSTYGLLPLNPISTVGVTAQLVVSDGLPKEFVKHVTREIFQRRARMAGSGDSDSVARRMRENYQPGSVSLPYHPGAIAYYERAQPPFLVEYAESLSLLLTVMVGLYSGYLGLRQWIRRSRKNRIDEYYVEAVGHAVDPAETDLEVLTRRRMALIELRQRAFSDLVHEKLDADESFTILQDHINSELTTIEAKIQQHG
jgi:TRAP transporter TAXI family solute receptor